MCGLVRRRSSLNGRWSLRGPAMFGSLAIINGTARDMSGCKARGHDRRTDMHGGWRADGCMNAEAITGVRVTGGGRTSLKALNHKGTKDTKRTPLCSLCLCGSNTSSLLREVFSEEADERPGRALHVGRGADRHRFLGGEVAAAGVGPERERDRFLLAGGDVDVERR
jgi:hypothetical protein